MTKKNQYPNKKKSGNFPLTYMESFLLSLTFLFSGFILQFFFGNIDFSILQWPINFFIGLTLIFIIVIVRLFFKKSSLTRWLGSVPAAVSSIIIFSIMALLLGFIPQTNTENNLVNNLGLNQITTTWPFFICLVLFLLTLGFTTAKRLIPFELKNSWFILNHLGLWITIATVSLGSGDILQYRIVLSENNIKWYAFDEEKRFHELPFKFELIEFNLEEYNPKITIIDNRTNDYIKKSGKNSVVAENNASVTINNWNILVKLFYKHANCYDHIFYVKDTIGAVPAAYVEATNLETKKNTEGWISCGNYKNTGISLELDSILSVIMLFPEPQKISSKINIINDDNTYNQAVLGINKPYNYKGWNIYQLSYETQNGKWSSSSLIEMVKDPWLPFVYMGFIMMIVGAFFIFWRGKS